jgi:hypothetical protein
MAKKSSGFNMSQAIRDYLAQNPNAETRQAYEAILAQNPKAKKSSFTVAFYMIKRGSKKKKAVAKKAAEAGMSVVDFEAIRLAKKLVDSIGVATALELIKAMQ